MSKRKRSINLIDDDDETASNTSLIHERSSKRRRFSNINHNDSDACQHPHYLKFAPLLAKIANSSYGHSSLFNMDEDILIHDDENKLNTKSRSSNHVQDNKRLKRENQKLKNENNELKEKLRILKNIATAFNAPKYQSIHIDKACGSIASQGMTLIKQKMMEKFNESQIVIKFNDNQHRKFRKAIKRFLNKNKNHINCRNNASNPFIVIKEKESTKNKNKKISVFQKQRNVLQLKSKNITVQHGHCHPNQMDILFDSFQLYSTKPIMGNTVLGEYNGLILTESEFEDVYKDSYFKDAANLYAFSQVIDVEHIDHILISDDDDEEDEDEDIDNDQNRANHNDSSKVIKTEDDELTEDEAENKDNEKDVNEYKLRSAIDDIKNHDNKFVLDALGYMHVIDNQDHLLMFTPDCRDDINVTSINDQEQNRINMEFVTAIINGFPRIFAISTRDIEANEAICGYFGEEFTAAKYQAVKGKITRSRMIAQIDWVLNNPLIHID